jgi:flagellar hook protein FlgE
MLSSFFSGISGLRTNTDSINVVGNNIANVNTVGFKGSRATFEDALYQSIFGASGTSQVGRGAALSTVDTLFAQGSFESTSQPTDLAIGGKGFFIVQNPDSQLLYYTRAGEFRFDKEGNMTNPAGLLLQGKQIDRLTHAPVGVDTDIIISPEPSQPRATEQIAMALNLQEDIPSEVTFSLPTGSAGPISATSVPSATTGGYPVTGAYTATYDSGTGEVTLNVAADDGSTYTYHGAVAAGTAYENFGGSGITITTAGTLTNGDSQAFTVGGFDDTSATTRTATSNYSSSLMIYDSIGRAHEVTVYFNKTAQGTWQWHAVAPDSTGGTIEGTLRFDNSGILQAGSGAPTAINLTFQGTAQQVQLAFNGELGGNSTTQYPIASTTNFQSQDGYPPGVLLNVTVSPEGIIAGHYSNGQILDLYQLTLANFNNTQGLSREGGNLYAETLESGVPYTSAPGANGSGKISPNSLEQSNVDLATEFVKMIVAQRGFQANARVITTSDEILTELMNIKR